MRARVSILAILATLGFALLGLAARAQTATQPMDSLCALQIPLSEPEPKLAAPTPSSLLDRAGLDPTVSPCQDFYQYANGGWLASHPLPAQEAVWGRFHEVEERNRERVRAILEEAVAKGAAATGAERKVGDFYASCMDERTVEARGFDPIRPELARIEALASVADLPAEIARLHGFGANVVFFVGPSPDLDDSRQMILDVLQAGLGLPDRDDYVRDDADSDRIREDYVRHVARMFELLGDAPERAAQRGAAVLALESRLAAASKTRAQRREVESNHHVLTLAQMDALTPSFSWPRYFQEIGAGWAKSANVRVPELLKAFDAELSRTPLADWKSYLTWHLLDDLAPALPTRFAVEDFRFAGTVLQGTSKMQPRWQRCVGSVEASLGEALGRLYVERYFPPEARERALAMVGNLFSALEQDLAAASWMTEPTRREAGRKLAATARKIGSPERWTDFSTLAVGPGPYAANVLAANQFEFRRQISRAGKPVDRGEWEAPPFLVDAYYNPSNNEVVFPAGILQPPFFSAGVDDAVDYGAAGSFIGHELTHGFDDQGSRFDAQGNLHNWWTGEDLAKFRDRTRCIAGQFGAYVSRDGTRLNGNLVVGEAIADVGGLEVAWSAFQRAVGNRPQNVVDGFTPEQRFFLAFAQVWAENVRPEHERLQVNANPHPPVRFRVNGAVSNLPAFAQAFGCKPGDPMARPVPQRCEIW